MELAFCIEIGKWAIPVIDGTVYNDDDEITINYYYSKFGQKVEVSNYSEGEKISQISITENDLYYAPMPTAEYKFNTIPENY